MEDILAKAQEMQQQSEQAEENLKVIEDQINQLDDFLKNIDFLNDSRKRVLSSVGLGVFVETEKKESDFYVSVGSGILVRKNLEETKRILKDQLVKFRQARTQILQQIEFFTSELQKMVGEIENLKNN